jgi:hypothetical protein
VTNVTPVTIATESARCLTANRRILCPGAPVPLEPTWKRPMARGGQVSPVATIPALPKVSFQKIDDDGSTQPSGVHDGQARTFGCTFLAAAWVTLSSSTADNDFSEFHRPDQYIRHIGEFLL